VTPAQAQTSASRVRPVGAAEPSEADWKALGQTVEGALVEVRSPVASCQRSAPVPDASACDALFKSLKKPYALGDDFARTRNSCLVVKGGGHSYQGTSKRAGFTAGLRPRLNRPGGLVSLQKG